MFSKRNNYCSGMMGVQVVLVLSLLDSVFSAATAGCPCLVDDGGALSAYRNPDNTLNYQGHSYPSDYGFGACKQWDIDPNPLPPYCTSPAPPEFCGDSWCYIDPNNCDLPLQYSSGVFPDSGLTFSSQTCGNAGTYSDYFSTGSGHSLTELADVVEDYVKSLTQKLEFAILENDFTSACDYTSSCHCQTCTPSTAWGTDVDFTRSLLKPYQDDPNSVTTLSSCLAGDADSYFSRVAGREYQNVDEFATLYVGFQEDGVFMQWPAMEFCSATYDPRFRPWYAAAATNPKMAVMVIDVSGSMRGTRIQLARQAALAVLDTLTAADQVGIVLFNEAPTNVFGPFHVSEGNRTAAIAFINANVVAGGGTAFTAPINLGLDMLASSEHCDSLLLFMTDGVPNAGFEMQESDYLQIKARAAAHNSTIFTYALGNSADAEATKRIACDNQGIFYSVQNSADLPAVMSGYYEYFAESMTNSTVRWVSYNDFATGTPLLSGCSPFYDRRNPDALTTTLAGVICMDINLMKSVTNLMLDPDWPALRARVQEPTLQCLPRWVGVQDVQASIESIRQRNTGTGAETCSSTAKTAGTSGGVIAIIVVSCVVFFGLIGGGFYLGSKAGATVMSKVAPFYATQSASAPAPVPARAPAPAQPPAYQQPVQVQMGSLPQQPQPQPQMYPQQPQMYPQQPQMYPQQPQMYPQQPQMYPQQPQMYPQQPQMYPHQPQMYPQQPQYGQQPPMYQ